MEHPESISTSFARGGSNSFSPLSPHTIVLSERQQVFDEAVHGFSPRRFTCVRFAEFRRGKEAGEARLLTHRAIRAASGILFEKEVNSRAPTMPNKLFPALDTA